MERKIPSELSDMFGLEKEAAAIGDIVESLKGVGSKISNIGGDVGHDLKKMTGVEKFEPKHNIVDNAVKGAGAGAVAGAAGGVATNTGKDKDNAGAALKGGLIGAVGGAALGAGGSHMINKSEEKTFNATNDAFKRGLGTGALSQPIINKGVNTIKDKTPDAIKNMVPDKAKQRMTETFDKVKSGIDDAKNNVKNQVKETTGTDGSAKEVIDKAKEKGSSFVSGVSKHLDNLKGKIQGDKS